MTHIAHGLQGGFNHLCGHLPQQGFISRRGRGIGAHAAGVGPRVAFADLFMILGRGQDEIAPAIGEHKQRKLVAADKLFHHQGVTGIAETLIGQDAVNAAQGFGLVRADQNPFTGGQPVGLKHHGKIFIIRDIGAGGVGIVKHGEGSCRYILFAHHFFGKSFAAFQQGGAGLRAKQGQAAFFKQIGDTHNQGYLRPHHRKVDPILFRKGGQTVQIIRRQGHALRQLGDTGVAGRAIDTLHHGTLTQLPDQGMFPAAAANH